MEGACIRCTSHAMDNDGYPIMWRKGKCRRIARMILIRRVGNIPSVVVTRHTCDNEWCIRPDHIISGTQLQNIADREKRGRGSKGESRPASKLTSLQVLQIREATGVHREIAQRFNIHQSQVSRIRNRLSWKHV